MTVANQMSPSTSYLCDTLPAPRLASSSPSPAPPSPPTVTAFQAPILDDVPPTTPVIEHTQLADHTPQPPARKLCVRHQRMADEGTNLRLQQALDALPVEERQAVNTIWSTFSSSPHPRRALILHGLLTMCCFSQLSLLSDQLSYLIRLDPFSVLPQEVSLRILKYLDATSLCRAAQVSRQWQCLADDNTLWRGICEQHIGQKCAKCGWGLPVLEKRRRIVRIPSLSPSPSPAPVPSPLLSNKRPLDQDPLAPGSGVKRARLSANGSPSPAPSSFSSQPSSSSLASLGDMHASPPNPLLDLANAPIPDTVTRPWKDVYCERLTIERNWRRGRCTVRTLKGHTDGVMCLQFSETLSHPAFPILITGSYDRTARVWNLETGREIHCLTGHTRAVRALQFDEAKLITGSMDHTMKVWDWRAGTCLRTLEGHTQGVVCLNFDSSVLASGSVDSTVKVWNFRTGECFTLRGHRDWVNSVQLWDAGVTARTSLRGPSPGSSATHPAAAHIDPGKMLFSASDDGTIRLWDLVDRTCVLSFTGHVGQVQSLKLLAQGCDESDEDSTPPSTPGVQDSGVDPPAQDNLSEDGRTSDPVSPRRPILISGSLDNTIKMWDIESGNVVKTLFGHIEGVWAVASDNLRLVSGSHDRTIKVWNRDEGRCTATLVGHRGAVTCLALGDDKIVSGSDDGDVRVWSFSG